MLAILCDFSLIIISVLLGISLFVIYVRCSFRKCTSKVNMKDKVVIVTGANGGIGFYTARSLAKRGARVILACRSKERGIAAQETIKTETENSDVVYKKLNLASLKSVRQFADDVLTTEPALHVLINNAGVYSCDDVTNDGIIETMQVNYFGHFLLTLLLLPLLKKSGPSRIINLSSILHYLGGFNSETINIHSGSLGSFWNYCNSKFCMLMFTLELSRRLEGSGVVANAVHPGVILSGLTEQMSFLSRFLFGAWCLMYKRTSEQGAHTVEHVAVAEECADISGKYFVDCAPKFMLWKAKSTSDAEDLWRFSEEIVKFSQNN